MMNRRDFMRRMFGVTVTLAVAPQLFIPEPIVVVSKPIGLAAIVADYPRTGTIGAINRATFSFWRSQQLSPLDIKVMRAAMDSIDFK